jgi:hypothetical protein
MKRCEIADFGGATRLDLADGFQTDCIAPRREPGEHPAQRCLLKQVAVGERAEGAEFDFFLVQAAHTGRVDLDAPTAKRHLARLVAMPVRGSFGIVLAFRSSQPNDLGLEQLVQHGEADTDREGQHSLLGSASQLAQGDRNLLG